jgi:hypothetical protein
VKAPEKVKPEGVTPITRRDPESLTCSVGYAGPPGLSSVALQPVTWAGGKSSATVVVYDPDVLKVAEGVYAALKALNG